MAETKNPTGRTGRGDIHIDLNRSIPISELVYHLPNAWGLDSSETTSQFTLRGRETVSPASLALLGDPAAEMRFPDIGQVPLPIPMSPPLASELPSEPFESLAPRTRLTAPTDPELLLPGHMAGPVLRRETILSLVEGDPDAQNQRSNIPVEKGPRPGTLPPMKVSASAPASTLNTPSTPVLKFPQTSSTPVLQLPQMPGDLPSPGISSPALPSAPDFQPYSPAATRTLPGWVGILAFVGCLLLTVFLFRLRIPDLYRVWQTDDNYKHGFVIPLVSIVLGWLTLRRQGWPWGGDLRIGVTFVVLGCLMKLVGTVFWFPPLDCLALASILYGIVTAVGGPDWARGFGFPILFLCLMFPLPVMATTTVGMWLQEITALCSTKILQLFAMPVVRQGYRLRLPEILEVGDPNHGIRYFTTFIAATLFYGFYRPRSWQFRVLLLVGSVPIFIIANCLRTIVCAVLVHNGNARWVDSYHLLWDLGTVAVGIGMLLLLGWWLRRALEELPLLPSPPADLMHAVPEGKSLVGRLIAVGVCVFAGMFGAYWLNSYLESSGGQKAVAPARPLNSFALAAPLRTTKMDTLKSKLPPSAFRNLEPLRDKEFANEQEFRRELAKLFPGNTERVDEIVGEVSFGSFAGGWYLRSANNTAPSSTPELDSALMAYYSATPEQDRAEREYEYGGDLVAKVWMIYQSEGQNRNHHPRNYCRVAGYVEDESARETIPITNAQGDSFSIERMRFTSGSSEQNILYWHYALEPEKTNTLTVLQQVHTKRWFRTPGITVQVLAGKVDSDGLKRLTELAKTVEIEMREFLPANVGPAIDTPAWRFKDVVGSRGGRHSYRIRETKPAGSGDNASGG